MGCRCAERAQALRRAKDALVRGDLSGAKAEMNFTARTLVEDARSGDLRKAIAQRLTAIKAGRR